MYHLHVPEIERQENINMNLPSKATVKKQFSNRFIPFNEVRGKQNQYRSSNLLANLNKKTVRKLTDENEQNIQQFCANHEDRVCEYLVKIDDQILKYCRKCATHIASQGFDVHKIGSPERQGKKSQRSSHNIVNDNLNQMLLPNISPNRGRQSNTSKEWIDKQKRMQLLTLVKSLKQLKQQYREKYQNLTDISETFQREKQILNSYYDQLISYIVEIKEIHLQAIDQSAINTVQVCEIQKGEIEQTLGEIQQMMSDIEGNFENIITQVDEQNYAECFEFYKQKQCIFSHRLEELGTEAKPWPCSNQAEITSKIQTFKNFVNQLHQVGDSPNQPQEQQQQIQYY